MAAKKKASAMDALIAFMKKNPKAEYANARDALAKGGDTIYPIMWGRAQVLLGRVKAKKRGTGKKAAASGKPARKKAAGRKVAAKRGGKQPAAAARKVSRGAARAAGGDIAVDAADLGRWQSLVEHLNGGGKVALQYDGSGWILTTRV